MTSSYLLPVFQSCLQLNLSLNILSNLIYAKMIVHLRVIDERRVFFRYLVSR